MVESLQKQEEETPTPAECPKCHCDTVRRDIRQEVDLTETYRGGELVDTSASHYGRVLKRVPWTCPECKNAWYDPPRKLTVRIEHDDDPMSPREHDNLGIMVCFHQRYNLGDETDLKESMFEGWDELHAHLVEEGATHILPLFLYDHSGITMNTTGFACGFDSGQVGFIYATKKTIEALGVAEENVEEQLKGEVSVYDQLLTGDVWGYIIEDDDNEEIDSCWGFFGREHVEAEAEEARKAHEHTCTNP